MIYLPYALELAKQRSREAEQRSREIDMIALATLAGRVASYPQDPRQHDRGDREPGRPGLMRRLVARPVRAISAVTYVVADATCAAATRIEGSSVH